MLIGDAPKHTVPVWPPKVSRRTERGDRVLLGTDVLYDDVVHVIIFDFRRQVYVDLDPVLRVLFFDRVEERVEPFGGAKVADDPGEVNLRRFGVGVKKKTSE